MGICARGLRSVMENIMTDLMYQAPSEKDIEQVLITKASVLGEEKPRIIRKNGRLAQSAGDAS